MPNQLNAESGAELKPCGHMANLLSRRSDESLTGPAKWYTDFHVMTCPHCKRALEGLRELHNAVDQLANSPADPQLKLSEGDWATVEREVAEPRG